MKRIRNIKTSKLTNVLTVIFIVFIIVGTFLLIYTDYKKQMSKTVTVTADDIMTKLDDAISKYEYVKLMLRVGESSNKSDDTQITDYLLEENKDKTDIVYIVQKDATTLKQYFKKNKDNWSIYLYNNDENKWYKTVMKDPPVSTDVWNLMSGMSDFKVSEDKAVDPVTGKECIVLNSLTANDTYNSLYLSLYIDPETYLPVTLESDGELNSGSELATDETGFTTDATVSTVTQVYNFEFSNENIFEYGEPKESEDYKQEGEN